MAYAETTVKPVVSDFDTFLVGSRGMSYRQLDKEQVDLAVWTLHRTREILETPSASSWTTRWLEVMKVAHDQGLHPTMSKYGLGDATSIRLCEAIIHSTSDSGAVRHGAECFNFYMPQELDDEYLVIWDGFEEDDKPWTYMDEDEMRDFLLSRVEEGYSCPLNPVWLVRDEGWFEVFEAQCQNPETKRILEAWYPEESGIVKLIEEIHEKFPDGFEQDYGEVNHHEDAKHWRSPSKFVDLSNCERAVLAGVMAQQSSRRRWSAAMLKVTALNRLGCFPAAETGASPEG